MAVIDLPADDFRGIAMESPNLHPPRNDNICYTHPLGIYVIRGVGVNAENAVVAAHSESLAWVKVKLECMDDFTYRRLRAGTIERFEMDEWFPTQIF